jgi:hypothetical protein
MINFPASPSPGQIFSYGLLNWQWNGTGWAAIASSSPPVGSGSPFIAVLCVTSCVALNQHADTFVPLNHI